MKYKLIAPVSQPSAVTQVLLNRGIDNNKIRDYTLVSDKDINPPEAFGEERLKEAVQMVAQNIKNNSKTIIIVDPDVDGNTSSALLLNFLYDLFPDWTKNIKIYFHTGKQHGLGDCKDYILENNSLFIPSKQETLYGFESKIIMIYNLNNSSDTKKLLSINPLFL